MSEFDGVKNVTGWRDKLAELLEAAKRAASSDDHGARRDVADRLNLFIERSRPQSAEMDQMDDIAGNTALSLMKQTIDERMAELTVRGTELAKLTKALDAQAETASASADSIRLTKIREVVDVLTRSVHSLNEFSAAIDGEDTAVLVSAVEDLLSRIQEVRNTIESGAVPKSASRTLAPAAAVPRGQGAGKREKRKHKAV